MAGLSSIVGARGHEKRGCRWRARINQTGVKINCKTLASRVPFPPPLPPSSLSISAALPSPSPSPPPLPSSRSRGFRALPVNRVTFLCVPPLPPHPLPLVPPARSFRVRSLFLRARVLRVRRVCASVRSVCARALYARAKWRSRETSWIEREVSLRGEARGRIG